MNRVLAAVFTLPFLACSNPPDPGGPPATTGGGTTSTSGGTGNTGGAGNAGGTTTTGGTTNPGGGAGGTTPTAGTGGADPTAGSGGTGGSVTPGTCPANVVGHCSQASYPTHAGFTLALVEDFDVAIDLDTDPIWTWSDGGPPEGATRFKKENITFEAGSMKITAKEEFVAGGQSYAENTANYAEKDLSSGEMRTKFNNYRYGRYEARFKAPTVGGAQPPNYISTLFVFRTPKFQEWREVDIELLGDAPTGSTTNVIYANNQGGWSPDIQEFIREFPAGNGAMPLPTIDTLGFNTYAFEWTPTQIRWYVNDVMIRVKDPGGIMIPDNSAKIMMNLWIFPSTGLGGDPNNNIGHYPFNSEYDYIYFWKWDTEDFYPCSPTPTCLQGRTPDDLDEAKNNPNDGL